MAKFIYKMQNILDVKYTLEDQAKAVYSNVRAKLNQEELVLQKLQEKKLSYEEITRSLIRAKLNILEIKTNENAIETVKYKIKVQIVVVKQAEQKLEVARGKLNIAITERKIYEKLRENAYEEFKKEQNALERKEIDEIVSFKYNKTTSSEVDK